MVIKQQYFVTIFSFIILSGFTYLLWLSDQNLEYSGFGMFIHMMLGYLLALISGAVALIRSPFTHKKSIYNFIGTFNIHVAIVGTLFVFFENSERPTMEIIAMQIILFILHLMIGLFILKNIFFSNISQKQIRF